MSTQGADYSRMLKSEHAQAGSVALGFGVMFVTFCVVTLLGSYISTTIGQTNPGSYFVSSLGAFGLFVVFITQVRINVVNMYSGSLAYSNSLHMSDAAQKNLGACRLCRRGGDRRRASDRLRHLQAPAGGG